jgi:hypothetical protein
LLLAGAGAVEGLVVAAVLVDIERQVGLLFLLG